MRVFVDTNVWLAGRFGRGLCANLLDTLVEENVEILLDERVPAEFRRVAQQKFSVDACTLEEADVFFRRYAHIVASAEEPCGNIPDPDDAWIIAAALTARADSFLTGDKVLHEVGYIQSMEIIDPRSLFMRLRGLA